MTDALRQSLCDAADEIDAEIGRLQELKDKINEQLGGDDDDAPDGKPAKSKNYGIGSRGPRKPKAAAAAAESPKKRDRGENRMRIARFLKRNGPTRPTAIMAACDIPGGSITSALNCDWFTRNEDRTVQLSAAGEAVVEDE